MKRKELADLIFPKINQSIIDLEKKYPKRKLKKGQEVTRFAPSPTGFLHTGSLFTSLISWKFAKQSNGIFYARLEDTDTKREVKGSKDLVLKQLEKFKIIPDESYQKKGLYGPYTQSLRKGIYDIVIKEMIIKDLAYPCFMTQEELKELREKQEKNKINPGYYGKYARDRFLSQEEAIDKIRNNTPYVIRFKSNGKEDKKINVKDLIKGELELPENMQDIVIMKNDGLPTYHFAHLVDDHFMRTTIITRGEEWLSSLPIHIQLFDSMNWERPKYAHLPLIMKKDNDKKRKLSKRKDPEASVDYFLNKGYPHLPFLEYLLTIANSNFEEWRIQNKEEDIFRFKLTFEKMQSSDGALFDVEKLDFISKEYLGNLTSEKFLKESLTWAKEYDKNLFDFISKDKKYYKEIIGIERGGEKPRKDYASFSEVLDLVGFMSDDVYYKINLKESFDDKFENSLIKKVITSYLENININGTSEEWFSSLKEKALSIGFAKNNKVYKKEPDKYLGTISDFAEILRVSISGKKSIPNFYLIQRILGKKRVEERLLNSLKLF